MGLHLSYGYTIFSRGTQTFIISNKFYDPELILIDPELILIVDFCSFSQLSNQLVHADCRSTGNVML